LVRSCFGFKNKWWEIAAEDYDEEAAAALRRYVS
jgi:hypothetical protein